MKKLFFSAILLSQQIYAAVPHLGKTVVDERSSHYIECVGLPLSQEVILVPSHCVKVTGKASFKFGDKSYGSECEKSGAVALCKTLTTMADIKPLELAPEVPAKDSAVKIISFDCYDKKAIESESSLEFFRGGFAKARDSKQSLCFKNGGEPLLTSDGKLLAFNHLQRNSVWFVGMSIHDEKVSRFMSDYSRNKGLTIPGVTPSP